jgi:hypothetical protein
MEFMCFRELTLRVLEEEGASKEEEFPLGEDAGCDGVGGLVVEKETGDIVGDDGVVECGGAGHGVIEQLKISSLSECSTHTTIIDRIDCTHLGDRHQIDKINLPDLPPLLDAPRLGDRLTDMLSNDGPYFFG